MEKEALGRSREFEQAHAMPSTIRKTIEDPVSEALVDGRLDGREVTLELADHDGRAVLEI